MINFSSLEIHLPTGTRFTRETLIARVEVVSWLAAVRICLCGGTTSTGRVHVLPPQRHGLC